MNKTYEEPSFQIVDLATEDIMAASRGGVEIIGPQDGGSAW